MIICCLEIVRILVLAMTKTGDGAGASGSNFVREIVVRFNALFRSFTNKMVFLLSFFVR